MDYVIALSVHVRASDPDAAYAHVAKLCGALDDDYTPDDDGSGRPQVAHLHAAGPFLGVPDPQQECVESTPFLYRDSGAVVGLERAEVTT